jgi:hypothetical protein
MEKALDFADLGTRIVVKNEHQRHVLEMKTQRQARSVIEGNR